MGSGISRTTYLKCPKDYDAEDFKKILKLYDKLDDDGNMIVEENELTQIAIHHHNNKNKNIEQELIDNEANRQKIQLELKLKLEQQKRILENKYKSEVNLENLLCDNNNIRLNKELELLNNLTIEEKRKKFKEKITDDKDHIKFWKFFDYIKNRVDDIDNINWVTPKEDSSVPKNESRKPNLTVVITSP